jgi:hypothetical protein
MNTVDQINKTNISYVCMYLRKIISFDVKILK